MQLAARRVELDALTIASIGIVAHVVANLVHEDLGHGGGCLLTGGHPLLVTTVNMDCSAENRLVTAGGSLMNAAAACVFFFLARAISRESPRWKYFAWLSMTVNILSAAGYLAFSGIGNFGDWAVFIEGWNPPWAWRIALVIAGAAGYMLAVRWSLVELRPLTGSGGGRWRIATRLCLPAYLAGGIVACVAGALNPQGWILVALSAAASTFGASSALAWMPQWLRGNSIPPGPDAQPVAIERSWAWIIAAAAIGVCFIAVLGPGIHFAGSVAH